MATRENQAGLSAKRKGQLAAAFLKLKNEVPSKRGLASRYDDFVQIHLDSMFRLGPEDLASMTEEEARGQLDALGLHPHGHH